MREFLKILYHKLHPCAPRLFDYLWAVWKRFEGPQRLPIEETQEIIEDVQQKKVEIQNPIYYEAVFSRKANVKIDIHKLNIAFIIPEPIKGSGGHRNFYRAIKWLHEFGHEMTVYYTQTKEPADVVKNRVSEWFYDMTDISYICYDGRLGYHDIVIATWWETAYMLKNNLDKVKYPCYFVQDFEPAFYPVNSNYILAENSYRLGFSHICSGKWCKDFLVDKYHAEAEFFQFPVDKSIYNIDSPRTKKNRNIIFFAKPDLDRRCYELGIMALKRIYEYKPDIEIILFGSNYVNSNNIQFPVTALGLLPTLQDLANLYRNADLGIVFSTTNPSLVPYEMLSCGCPVVDLDLDQADSKYGGSKDRVFLCDPDPEVMAKQICSILDSSSALQKCADAGRNWVLKEFPSEFQMAQRIEKMLQNLVLKGRIQL